MKVEIAFIWILAIFIVTTIFSVIHISQLTRINVFNGNKDGINETKESFNGTLHNIHLISNLSFVQVQMDYHLEHEVDVDNIIRLPQYATIQYKAKPHFKNSANILFWNPLYDKLEHWFWWFHSDKHKSTCPELNCTFTIDKAQVNSSDAVVIVIYGDSFNLTADINSQLPPYRNENQRYIYFSYEPPKLVPTNVTKLNGVFNWTMTYRRDSDVRAHFGRILLNKNCKGFDEYRNYAMGKHKLVAWFVGHCNTEGKRETYVEQLKEFIDIDVYGPCGTKTCSPPRSKECYEVLGANYKFYLSFENILCKDYVSEKFVKPLANDVVPIVFGGSDYSLFAPEGSYIDALKFSSPKVLATYLKYLNNNDTEYNRFFDWKRGYDAHILQEEMWNCELCLKLLDPDQPKKVYNDFDSWWNVESECRTYNWQ